MATKDGSADPRTAQHADDHAATRLAEVASANRLAMVRCVVAAETYRVTAQLPEWARDTRF